MDWWANCVIRLPMFLSLPARRRIRDPSQSGDVKGNQNFSSFWEIYRIFLHSPLKHWNAVAKFWLVSKDMFCNFFGFCWFGWFGWFGTVPLPLLTAQPLPVRVTDDLHMAKFDSRYAVPTLLVSVFLSNVAAHLHWSTVHRRHCHPVSSCTSIMINWWSGCKLEPVFCSRHYFLDSPISKIGLLVVHSES